MRAMQMQTHPCALAPPSPNTSCCFAEYIQEEPRPAVHKDYKNTQAGPDASIIPPLIR